MFRPCLIALSLAFAGPVHADCRDTIDALFDGGPLDPFARPPHRYVRTTTGPDGTVRMVYRATFETPVRSLGRTESMAMEVLILGSESWIRTDPAGDWTAAPNMVPEDHEAFVRLQMDQQRANLGRTACPGATVIDGATYDTYRFFTRTDPVEASGGAWFGGLNTIHVDPGTGLVMVWEVTEAVSSFAPEPSADRDVAVYTYDAALTLPRPE